MLLAVPVLFSLESLNPRLWRDMIVPEHFTVVSLTTVLLFVVGFYLRKKSTEAETKLVGLMSATLVVGGGLYASALIWLVLHALLETDLATMMALIVYTVVGITLFVSGTTHEQRLTKMSGAVLVGFVVFRLLFIEVWNMDLGGRIITFLVIGALLISTAFIRKLHPSVPEQSSND